MQGIDGLDYSALDDDQASPLDTTATPLDLDPDPDLDLDTDPDRRDDS